MRAYRRENPIRRIIEVSRKPLGKCSETELQRQIVDLAKAFKWWVYHTYDSRKSTPGFPDLVLIRPPRVIFAELKSDAGRLTAEQANVLELLRQCGQVESYIWRPKDWATLVDVLR